MRRRNVSFRCFGLLFPLLGENTRALALAPAPRLEFLLEQFDFLHAKGADADADVEDLQKRAKGCMRNVLLASLVLCIFHV